MTLGFNNTKLNFNTYNYHSASENNRSSAEIKTPLPFTKQSLNILSSYNKAFVSFKESLSLVDFEKTLQDHSYYRFTPDRYQKDSAKSIFIGNNLIVTAPTGTGKTLIAEYAIRNALNKNNGYKSRVFYTSPLKALSNYHYNHFKSLYGEENVGIITGERKKNVKAPIIVMTTEVYRNMVYNNENNSQLANLDSVIFDEFHYMNDPDRGSVWEESMLLTPNHVKKIMLSATIGNFGQIQNWLNSLEPKSVSSAKSKQTDLVSVSPSERNVPLEFFLLHQLPVPEGAEKTNRPFLVSKLTKEIINYDNLKSDLLKNTLSEVQKSELINFYSTLNSKKELISNNLEKSKFQLQIFEMLMQDKNNPKIQHSLNPQADLSRFIDNKITSLNNFLESLTKLSSFEKKLIGNKLNEHNIKNLYDIIYINDNTETGNQLKDVVNSFNILVKNYKTYDSFGHSLFNSIKNGDTTDLNDMLVNEISLNKNAKEFIDSVTSETLINSVGLNKTIIDVIHNKVNSSIRDKKVLAFMLDGISTVPLNDLEKNLKKEHLLQHCSNIITLNKFEQKNQHQMLVSFLKNEKTLYKKVLSSANELFESPENLKILLENINITSLSDIQDKSKHLTDFKSLKPLQEILNIYLAINKKDNDTEELGKHILSAISSQNPQDLYNFIDEKIQEATMSIHIANSLKPKITDSSDFLSIINAEQKRISRENKTQGITDDESLQKVKSQKEERNSLQKALIILAKIASPDNDEININDISSISSIKKSYSERLKIKLQDLLSIKEEEANRLSLILASKESKELYNTQPMQRNGYMPPSKVIKFFKTYKDGNFLPLIYFIFSKAECNSAVEHLLKNKENLLNKEEKLDVKKEVDDFLLKNKYFQDLLQNESIKQEYNHQSFTRFIEGISKGYAVHHKGLLPPQKELVERLFSKKLLKVVFATETIAAGLDFPAKTVIIDSLEQPYKDFEIVSANKFHQISGRAGRRGKDSVGNVVILNKVNNTKGLAFNLINSQPDNINSNFKLSYGLALEMFKNNPFVNPKEIFQNTFAVFQSDKPINKRDFSQKNDILFDLEDAIELVKSSQEIFKKRDSHGKIDLYLKNKRDKCIKSLEKSPYCIKRYEVDYPEKINAQFNKLKLIQTHLLGALGEYEFLFQKNFNDDSFTALEKNKFNRQKTELIHQIDEAITLLNTSHQKLHLNRLEKKDLKEELGAEFEEKLIENKEFLKSLRDCKFTLPFARDEYIKYQINLLKHIKAKLLNQTDKSTHLTDRKVVQPEDQDNSKLGSLVKEFEKRIGLLSFPSINNESIESLLIPRKGGLYLSDKGLIASKIHGVNEILASELVYGDKAFLKDLSPREIATTVSTLVGNILPEQIEKISSAPISLEDPLPEKIVKTIELMKQRALELEEMQIKAGLKGNGSKVKVVDNLINAVYDWSNMNNRFETVFNKSIKNKPFNYLEGDFAELIFRTIDLLKQLRNSLGYEDTEMKLKLQSAINLLIKPPLSTSIIDDKDDNSFNFVSTLYGNTNNRVNFKDISKQDIDLMMDHIRAGIDDNAIETLYSYINSSPASLADFDEALRIIFDNNYIDKVLSKASIRAKILLLFKNENKSIDEISETLHVNKNKVEDTIKKFYFDNENFNLSQLNDDILDSILLDGGYIFEQIAYKKLETEFLKRAKDFYETKTHSKIDDQYVKNNFRIVTNLKLDKNDPTGKLLGEIDLLVFDKNTKKVLLVSEFKVNGNDIEIGYQKRKANILQYNDGEIFPNKKVKLDDNETITFDENSFKWNPEVYVASTKSPRNTIIPGKPNNSIILPYDKVDILLMSSILNHELKKKINDIYK